MSLARVTAVVALTVVAACDVREVVLEMETREGTRRLRFGPEYCITPSQALRAELDQLLGPRALAA